MPEAWTKSTPAWRAISVNRNGLGSCGGAELAGVATLPARRSPSRAGPAGAADVAAGGDVPTRASGVATVAPPSQPARPIARAEDTRSRAIDSPEGRAVRLRVDSVMGRYPVRSDRRGRIRKEALRIKAGKPHPAPGPARSWSRGRSDR